MTLEMPGASDGQKLFGYIISQMEILPVTNALIARNSLTENKLVASENGRYVKNSAATLSDNGELTINNITFAPKSEILLNSFWIDLKPNTSGNGFIQIGDNEEWALFSWDSNGDPLIILSSLNISNSYQINKFCLFSNGIGGLRIKNALGVAKTINYNLFYR